MRARKLCTAPSAAHTDRMLPSSLHRSRSHHAPPPTATASSDTCGRGDAVSDHAQS